MARPKSTARLFDIPPDDVAIEVHRRLTSHMRLLAGPRGAAQRPLVDQDDVAHLATWAQHGGRRAAGRAIRTLRVLLQLLYTRPGDRRVAERAPIDETEIVGCVLAAAIARSNLLIGLPVLGPHLAALAGFNRSRIRQMVRDGKLRRSQRHRAMVVRAMDAPILASDARRLLSERAVPGFDDTPSAAVGA